MNFFKVFLYCAFKMIITGKQILDCKGLASCLDFHSKWIFNYNIKFLINSNILLIIYLLYLFLKEFRSFCYLKFLFYQYIQILIQVFVPLLLCFYIVWVAGSLKMRLFYWYFHFINYLYHFLIYFRIPNLILEFAYSRYYHFI